MNFIYAINLWLRSNKSCRIVLCERSPREGTCGRPDVLGITGSRYLIEVEIKRSLADFKANVKKRIHDPSFRTAYAKRLPKQFYFAVPPKLGELVQNMIPEWAGLLVVTEPYGRIMEVKPSPKNAESKRLSIKEMCHVAMLQSNQVQAQFMSICDLKGYERVTPDFII